MTLTATPAPLGSAFAGWTVEGDPDTCAGTGPCEVTMSAATTVKALTSRPSRCTPSPSRGPARARSEANRPGSSAAHLLGRIRPGHGSHPHRHPRRPPGLHRLERRRLLGHRAMQGDDQPSDISLSATFAPILHTLTVFDSGTGAGLDLLRAPPGSVRLRLLFPIRRGQRDRPHRDRRLRLGLHRLERRRLHRHRACEVTLGADTAVRAEFAMLPAPPREEAPQPRLILGRRSRPSAAPPRASTPCCPRPGTLTATGRDLRPASAVSRPPPGP